LKVTITEKESARYEFGNEFIPAREPVRVQRVYDL